MNIVTNNKWIGQRTIRPDGVDKVTGRAAFAADTAMSGMIWGKILRSPHPHARIRSIDTSKAEALPGVKAVVTSRDIVDFPVDKSVMLGIQDMRWMCRNVMAREKALFHGHPVAAVAATTRAIAAEIGGGFGGKTIVYLEPLALVLARKSGRPVKMVMTREEVFRASGPTSGAHVRIKIGAKKDGRIVAAEAELKYQAGAFAGSPVQPGCMCA